jgi:hypothetical protein
MLNSCHDKIKDVIRDYSINSSNALIFEVIADAIACRIACSSCGNNNRFFKGFELFRKVFLMCVFLFNYRNSN